MVKKDIIVRPWADYELIDSGGNRKLERFGAYTLVRPETQSVWEPKNPDAWKRADAEFVFAAGKGSWKKKKMPDSWECGWDAVRFSLRLTSFKHVGLFPEQAENWKWLGERAGALEHPKVLNLFGYTGVASIALAKHGALVTHVDASKQANTWAKDNARLSEVPEGGIRYLLDDALAFAEREVRRGSVYEGILLDPPAFGRGPKSEVWRIEESLAPLLRALAKLLSPKRGSFFLLNGYAAGFSPQSFIQAVADVFPNEDGEFGELQIEERGTGRVVPSGIYTRFIR